MHTQIATATWRMAGLAAIPLLAACSSGAGEGSHGQAVMSGDDGGDSASSGDEGTQGNATACGTAENVLNMMIDSQLVSVTGSNVLATVGQATLNFHADGLPVDTFTGSLLRTVIHQGATTITIGPNQTASFIVTGNGGTTGTVGGEFANGTVITINALAYHPTDPSEPAAEQTLDNVNMTFAGNVQTPGTAGTGYVEGCLNFVGTPGADQ